MLIGKVYNSFLLPWYDWLGNGESPHREFPTLKACQLGLYHSCRVLQTSRPILSNKGRTKEFILAFEYIRSPFSLTVSVIPGLSSILEGKSS